MESDDQYKLDILKVKFRGSLSDANGNCEFDITPRTSYKLLIQKDYYQAKELVIDEGIEANRMSSFSYGERQLLSRL